MATITEQSTSVRTAVDLVEQYGALPLSRLRIKRLPDVATAEDVVSIHKTENRLYELVDGLLLEKSMGAYEAYLAAVLIELLGGHVRRPGLGIVLAPDGMLRLAPGLVRIPDVSFIATERLPGGVMPRDAILDLAPNLAVEVVSKSNTPEEMRRKLNEYFVAGVEEVWYLYPELRELQRFTSPDQPTIFRRGTVVTSIVLPNFSFALDELFPASPPAK